MNRRIVFRPEAEREVLDAWHYFLLRIAAGGSTDLTNRCSRREHTARAADR